jgi:hypothetical protein
MTRLEKCQLLKEKGYTYNPDTGKIFGVKGKEITKKTITGYIAINGNNNFKGEVYGHHFGWYMTYGNVDFDILDHININPSDNRICNLRIVTHQENRFNTNAKGYRYNNGGWIASIGVNGVDLYLGRHKTEEEARNAYLEAKKIYHII